MSNKDYYYELNLIDGDSKITHKFPASITIEQLEEKLRDFLAGCSWFEETIDKLFNGGEE